MKQKASDSLVPGAKSSNLIFLSFRSQNVKIKSTKLTLKCATKNKTKTQNTMQFEMHGKQKKKKLQKARYQPTKTLSRYVQV